MITLLLAGILLVNTIILFTIKEYIETNNQKEKQKENILRKGLM